MAPALAIPLAPNLFPNLDPKLAPATFLRLAKSRYRPDHAAVKPAESTVNSERLRYVLKSKMGGKTIGSFWKGRAWIADIRVARSIGGSGDSAWVSRVCRWHRFETHTAPCFRIGEGGSFYILGGLFLRHSRQ